MTFVPSIHACSKRAESSFCLYLQKCWLSLTSRLFLFHSANHFHYYSYPMWGWRCPGNRKGLSGGSRILNKGGSSITIKAHVACLLRESGGMPIQEDSDPLRSILM